MEKNERKNSNSLRTCLQCSLVIYFTSMKKSYPIDQVTNTLTILRKAGYSPFRDPQTGEESFIVRLTPEFYPRFHLYVEQAGSHISFNLHLDQKKASYGTNHAHSGEYDGPTIEKEMARIDGWVKSENRQSSVISSQSEKADGPTKKSWLAKLFS